MQIAVLTVLAIVAFAANALLARWALGDELLDPASFASLRAVSAAVVLALLVKRTAPNSAAGPRPPRDFVAAAALAVFLLLVSYAYVTVDAGLGALLMVAGACYLRTAESQSRVQGWRCLTDPEFIAFLLVIPLVVYFLLPDDLDRWTLPEIAMIVAGFAAAVYSRRVGQPDAALAATSRNMTLAVIPVLALHVIVASTTLVTLPGVLIAVCTGALTTVGGFALWYAALPKLAAVPTAVARVSIPMLVIPCSVVLLGEQTEVRLIFLYLLLVAVVVFEARGRPTKTGSLRRRN